MKAKPKIAGRRMSLETYLETQAMIERIVEERTDLKRKMAVEQNRRDGAPILEELKQAGFLINNNISDIHTFAVNHAMYEKAIPILLSWLPRIRNRDVKSSIVGMLRVFKVKGRETVDLLIREFYKADEWGKYYRWEVGGTIADIATDAIFDEVVKIVMDKSWGADRWVMIAGLGHMKNPVAVDILIGLLNDESEYVVEHAIKTLRKLKAQRAYSYIEPLLKHPYAPARKEAEKFIQKFKPA